MRLTIPSTGSTRLNFFEFLLSPRSSRGLDGSSRASYSRSANCVRNGDCPCQRHHQASRSECHRPGHSNCRLSESITLGSSPCSHRRSVSLPIGTSRPAVILARSKRPRVVRSLLTFRTISSRSSALVCARRPRPQRTVSIFRAARSARRRRTSNRGPTSP